MTKTKTKSESATIIVNKKAGHDYFIEERIEAGLVLEGWEVKALRAGKVQLRDAYILFKNGEALLFGATITPLPTASTHIAPDPQRSRKLLLHKHQVMRLMGAVERSGYAAVATAMYWSKGRAKVEIGLARGKKQHDKRATLKERDWQIEQRRLLKLH